MRNNADSLVYQAEKAIKEVGEKADKALVEKVQKAADQLKESLKGTDIEKIKADTEELTKPLYEMSAAAYHKKLKVRKQLRKSKQKQKMTMLLMQNIKW